MRFLITFFVLAVINHASSTSVIKKPKLLLSVYYESLCPDSRNFIINQLLPVIELMYDYVRVKLVPFGKASSIDFSLGGFSCQHGPKECYGNMFQDCALHLMSDRSDLDRVKYVACEMDSKAGAHNHFKCVKQANVSVASVQQCILMGKGSILQMDSEYLTQEVVGPPWPAFIPTVTTDMKFNQEFQNYALVHLLGVICAKLQQWQPKPCQALYNEMALEHLFERVKSTNATRFLYGFK